MIFPFGSRTRAMCWLAACLAVLASGTLHAQTGTFIDRQLATDLRVMTYNILWDSIFPDRDATKAAKFSRVINALDPDLLNLQEIGDPFCGCTPKTASDVRNLLNGIKPLPDGASWNVYKGGSGDSTIASKYPLSMFRSNTTPTGDLQLAMALVDLPDDQFPADFYLMNNHYKCCGGFGSEEDQRRQRQSDANVNWLRDARTPGGLISLPPGTPFAVIGDLNIVGSQNPLTTLITGNIVNEQTYGTDSPPDWDGTSLTDPVPVHNGVGSTTYTWRNGSTSRLDYIIYSDSALDVGNKFVLNTVAMSASQREATGLQRFDTAQGNSTSNFDHLPVVVDFRIFDFATSDFDYNRLVDGTDLTTWQAGYGTTGGAARSQGDADGDGVVDGRDFLVWQRQYNAAAGGLIAVPEPDCLALLVCFTLVIIRRSAMFLGPDHLCR